MKYRNVGKSGLKVSDIAIGSWMTDLQGNLNADIAAETIRLAYENGVSEEWSATRLTESQKIIKELRLHPLTVVQPQYNMIDRYIEDEIIGVCEKYGMGITPFSPLAQGLLTGKYIKGQPYPEGSRATHQSDRQINNLLTEVNLDKVEKMTKIPKEALKEIENILDYHSFERHVG